MSGVSQIKVNKRRNIFSLTVILNWIGIKSHIHVEVVAEEIAIPMGIPSPVAVRLRIKEFTVTGSFFPLLCSSTDRGVVTGKGKIIRINETALYGFTGKLSVI